MLRRPAGRAALLLAALALLAAPAFAAGGRRAERTESLSLTSAFTRLWAAVVQHLPFANATAADTAAPDAPADRSEADRSAALDPWG